MNAFEEQSHYEFLGVETDATPDEIRRAVAKLREMFAPGSIALYSLVDQEEHKALLARLEEASVVLSDERARAAYDERHRLGRKVAEAPRKARPGPSAQLELTAIVGAVDGAPAWPGGTTAVTAPVPARAPAVPAPGASPGVAPVARPGEDAPAAAAAAPAIAAPAGMAPAATVETALAAVAPELSVAAAAEVLSSPLAGAPPGVAPVGASDAGDADIEVEVEGFEAEAAVAPVAPSAPTIAPTAIVPASARAAAPRRESPPAPARELPPLPALGPTTEYTGELLRQIREARGLTLRDLATKTRISLGHLEHVEAEAFRELPERVYLRGFLHAYARELKLDGARLSETYLARWAAARR